MRYYPREASPFWVEVVISNVTDISGLTKSDVRTENKELGGFVS